MTSRASASRYPRGGQPGAPSNDKETTCDYCRRTLHTPPFISFILDSSPTVIPNYTLDRSIARCKHCDYVAACKQSIDAELLPPAYESPVATIERHIAMAEGLIADGIRSEELRRTLPAMKRRLAEAIRERDQRCEAAWNEFWGIWGRNPTELLAGSYGIGSPLRHRRGLGGLQKGVPESLCYSGGSTPKWFFDGSRQQLNEQGQPFLIGAAWLPLHRSTRGALRVCFAVHISPAQRILMPQAAGFAVLRQLCPSIWALLLQDFKYEVQPSVTTGLHWTALYETTTSLELNLLCRGPHIRGTVAKATQIVEFRHTGPTTSLRFTHKGVIFPSPQPQPHQVIMAPGGPPGGGRGRGGKFKKFTRGGGKHFSKNLRPLDADGNEIEERDPNASTSEEEEDSSEEESSEEEDADKPAMTREERRAAAKAKKEAAIAKRKGVPQPGDLPSSSEEESDDDDMPANPNHSKAARNQAKAAPVTVEQVAEGVKDMGVGGKGKKPAAELSRREREALQAQQAKERYQKLHEAGKTDEAKADLARLKLIREKREQEAARKQAEKEEREAADKSKRTEIDAREAKRREAAMGGPKGKGKAKK
ncbi:uncharacterized protein BP5553_09076 [Venustampulla echinocandica]|uniref:Casein kinase substrate phosphoprotein PP28 domain-containing protein n=1 Tax=Venustampulla echinocandica TaxID=2656787 RepID=A0A370TDT2_9HELO|nr:uncharacterized protein BP5553_09076 [Venustampulla echinocandica]RDL32620.1 hypothetical protein BP5553_09076 [Venustampulla echinocandica]